MHLYKKNSCIFKNNTANHWNCSAIIWINTEGKTLVMKLQPGSGLTILPARIPHVSAFLFVLGSATLKNLTTTSLGMATSFKLYLLVPDTPVSRKWSTGFVDLSTLGLK